MLEQLTHARFAEHLHGKFCIHFDPTGPAVEVELIQASLLHPRTRMGERPPREGFSLIFRGPGEPWFPQRIYRVEHQRMGSFDLFLVPIGPDAAGMRYEAVFN
jgi:hypothetical protein